MSIERQFLTKMTNRVPTADGGFALTAGELGKLRDGKAAEIWQTERGTTFGYQNLVVDMRLNGGGNLQLEEAGGSVVYGSVNIPATGGWQNWVTVKHTVQLYKEETKW